MASHGVHGRAITAGGRLTVEGLGTGPEAQLDLPPYWGGRRRRLRVRPEVTPASLPGDHRALEPPESIPNSAVKRCIADGSVGSPHVRVGHRQAPIPTPRSAMVGAFYVGMFDTLPWGDPLFYVWGPGAPDRPL